MSQAGFFDIIRRALGWKSSREVPIGAIEAFIARTRTYARATQTRTLARAARTRTYGFIAEAGDDG